MSTQIQSDSLVSVRYPQLTVALGALIGVLGGGLGHLVDSRRTDVNARHVQAVHVASAFGGLSALLGLASHTLVGAVAGWGIAVGATMIAWVHAALAVATDSDPIGRSVAVGRTVATVAWSSAAGLAAIALAEPRHHSWWIGAVAVITLHQSVRRLRRMRVRDIEVG